MGLYFTRSMCLNAHRCVTTEHRLHESHCPVLVYVSKPIKCNFKPRRTPLYVHHFKAHAIMQSVVFCLLETLGVYCELPVYNKPT
jgi:hypothetical protein